MKLRSIYKKVLPFVAATALLGSSFFTTINASPIKPETAQIETVKQEKKKKWTVIGYMNGDNDLNDIVLYLMDRMEQVGSSNDVNIVVLYDGKEDEKHAFGHGWGVSKLLYITKDDDKFKINSKVLDNIKGEQDMGNPDTLEKLLKVGFEKFPADRYMLFTMTHGNGIIDSKEYPDMEKTDSFNLSMSPDETSGQQMSQREFTQAIKHAIDKYSRGKKLDVVMFFSCLMGMAEIDYSLKDVADYTISSENLIWLLRSLDGKSFTLEGIRFDKVFKALEENPEISIKELGKTTIDAFIKDYEEQVPIYSGFGGLRTTQFPGTLSLKKLDKYEIFANKINDLSELLREKIKDKEFLVKFHKSVADSQNYDGGSYRDINDLINKIIENTQDKDVEKIGKDLFNFVKDKIVLYEGHTTHVVKNSHGVSVFFPVYGIVEEFYSQYQKSYKNSQFSKDTHWDELIEEYQSLMFHNYADILIDEWDYAYEAKDTKELNNIMPNIYWELRRHIEKGEFSKVERFIDLVSDKDDLGFVSKSYFEYLKDRIEDYPNWDDDKKVVELKKKLDNFISELDLKY